MKIIKSVFLLVVFFIFATNQNAYSQDEVRAEKHENISWVRIGLVTFKPGKASAARDIIYNHFVKAGKATGNPTATSFELTAGEWHQLTIFPMNGPSDLEYSRTPQNATWWNQMAKQEGGADKAQELLNTFQSYVKNSTSYIARKKN